MLVFWIVVFIFSIFILIKGAGWLLNSSEKIGLSFGLSPFIIGVTIVTVGTSLPELITSFVAVFQGIPEFVVSNVVGSNIANILLILGLAAIFTKRLIVSKDLIDLDLPLVAISTVIFLIIAYDGTINFFESMFLVITFIVYLGFMIIHGVSDNLEGKIATSKIRAVDVITFLIGIIGLAVGAKYLVDSIKAISVILGIGVGLIAISAVAIGTSLPELFVSIKAAMRKQSEVAIGNIFGSNIFNILAVVGLPGLFRTLPINDQTYKIGLPILIISTILFIISGISRRINVQEGALYLLIYILFLIKLFGLF